MEVGRPDESPLPMQNGNLGMQDATLFVVNLLEGI